MNKERRTLCVVFAEISLRISAVGSQKKGLESGQNSVYGLSNKINTVGTLQIK